MVLPDWSTLPVDAIEFISTRLSTGADYTTFRSVCNSWRSAAPKKQQLPRLLVEYSVTKPDEPRHIAVELVDFPSGQMLRPRLLLTQKTICGSSHGWIALLENAPIPTIFLYNPLTRLDIRLPQLADSPGPGENSRLKLVLSSDPLNDDCVALAFCFSSNRLFFWRHGDAFWTSLSLPLDAPPFSDVIFYKGNFYAVSIYNVYVCQIGPEAHVIKIPPADPLFSDGVIPQDTCMCIDSFLVVSSGDLLMILQKCSNIGFNHYSCTVFRVDLENGQLRLLNLENLGGGVVFLDQLSTSVYAGNSPWCSENCIYFTAMVPKRQPNSNRVHFLFTIMAFSMEDGRNSVVLSREFPCDFHWLAPNSFY